MGGETTLKGFSPHQQPFQLDHHHDPSG